MSSTETHHDTAHGRVSSGVPGLDRILLGGLPEGRVFLVHGNAGTGKTTLGMQFLMAAARAGKRALCVTLLQTAEEIHDIIRSHGWNFDGVDVMELPQEVRDAATLGQTVFATVDVELGEVTDALEAAVSRANPDCLFIDSLSELGVLVDTGHQLRRQLIRLKERLDRLSCTTLLSAGPAGGADMHSLETLVHGVISLEMIAPGFGRPRRRVIVKKMRGTDFFGGYHDARIVHGGIEVFPRVLAPGLTEHRGGKLVVSGNPELDQIVGGGLAPGSTCAIMGSSGAGKSTLATVYVHHAVRSGLRAAHFCFDERPETLMVRSSGLGMPLEEHVRAGTLSLRQINVGDVSSGQFNDLVRRAVEEEGVRLIVMDSLSGYLLAMPDEHELITQLHELLSYLSAKGVITFMVVATHGLFGDADTPVDVSYIADTVVLLRHFEARGVVRRCIAVMKKRYGDHERTVREVRFGPGGLEVGRPLNEFSGVLTGLPRFEGDEKRLMDDGTG